jgi:hypothetical protein
VLNTQHADRMVASFHTPPCLQVLDKDGKVVPGVYCIGDANGKYMLAHAASAQVRGQRTGSECSIFRPAYLTGADMHPHVPTRVRLLP